MRFLFQSPCALFLFLVLHLRTSSHQETGARRYSRFANTSLCHRAALVGSPGLAEHCRPQGPHSSVAFFSNFLWFVLSFCLYLWMLEKLLSIRNRANPALFLLAIFFETGGHLRCGKLVHSDPDISGVTYQQWKSSCVKRWLLLSFLIATVVLNIFLNHYFMFDSAGVVFDRSISVCCDASPRESRHEWTHLSGRGFGLLLVFCGLSILKSHPSSTYKLSELGASYGGLRQSGLWR